MTTDLKPEMITAARHRLGLTQKETAEMLHVSTGGFSCWEQGVNRVPKLAWLALCLIIGEPESWRPTATEIKAAQKWHVDRRKAILDSGRKLAHAA